MLEKSHVGMGHNVCPICGAKHNEVVLLDTRLRPTLTTNEHLGYKLCPDCAGRTGEYIALVAATTMVKAETVKMEDARRTGEIAWVRRTVAARIFNIRMPDDLPFTFCDPEVVTILKQKMAEAEGSAG